MADRIASEGVSPPSDAFYDELLSRAGREGQRPRVAGAPQGASHAIRITRSPSARRRSGIAAILAATILLVAAVAGAGIAGARLLAADGTIVVDPSGNGTTTTIQDALAMADDGDEIVVRPGVYDAPITISEDVVLRGEDRDSRHPPGICRTARRSTTSGSARPATPSCSRTAPPRSAG